MMFVYVMFILVGLLIYFVSFMFVLKNRKSYIKRLHTNALYNPCLWLVSCVMNFEHAYFLRIFILWMFGFSISIHDSIVYFLNVCSFVVYILQCIIYNIVILFITKYCSASLYPILHSCVLWCVSWNSSFIYFIFYEFV